MRIFFVCVARASTHHKHMKQRQLHVTMNSDRKKGHLFHIPDAYMTACERPRNIPCTDSYRSWKQLKHEIRVDMRCRTIFPKQTDARIPGKQNLQGI